MQMYKLYFCTCTKLDEIMVKVQSLGKVPKTRLCTKQRLKSEANFATLAFLHANVSKICFLL